MICTLREQGGQPEITGTEIYSPFNTSRIMRLEKYERNSQDEIAPYTNIGWRCQELVKGWEVPGM